MVISDLATEYLASKDTCLLVAEEIIPFIVEATKEYQAWGGLKATNARLMPSFDASGDNGNIILPPMSLDNFAIVVPIALNKSSKLISGSETYMLSNFDGGFLGDNEIKANSLVAFTLGKIGFQCIPVSSNVDKDTYLTNSEWNVIKPLAVLFIEKESSLTQEASRYASYEQYGRTSSEIEQDIVNFRNEYFRQWAFSYECETI